MKEAPSNTWDVTIIGSGLGGLLCGAILSKEGMKVCVLEKQSQPGGCLQTFNSGGIPFDTGLHYIGGMLPGQPLYRYWQYLGLEKRLKLERLNPDCFDRICMEDQEYPIAQGFDNFREKLLAHFPGKKEALDRYTRTLEETVDAFPMYKLEIPDNRSEEHYRSISAYEFYRSLARDSLLPEVLAGNNFLYAGNPDKTPLHIPALINHSFISGAFRLAGGSGQLADVLKEMILAAGGTVLVNREVSRVREQNGLFTACTADREEFLSRMMISDIHPANFIAISEPALFTKAFRERIRTLENTISSFSLYLTLKDHSFPYLDHNIHYFDGEEAWTAFDISGDQWPRYYMLYTPHPSGDPRYAKSLIVITAMKNDEVSDWNNTRVGKRGSGYKEFKQNRSERLIELVAKKFPGIRQAIRTMEAATPLTWRDYTGTPGGSMYGIEKDFHDPVRSMILPRTKVR